MHSTRRTSSPKRRKSRMTLTLAIILTICTLWQNSCTTTHTAESKPAPQYYPPDPYDKNGVLVWTEIKDGETFTATEDGLFLPFWYWKKVYDYIVNTQAAQEIHKEIK